MMNYFADCSEEKFFRCAHCGASLLDGDSSLSPPSRAGVADYHGYSNPIEDEITDVSDECEIICTACGQHLGVIPIEEELSEIVPLWI